MTKDFSDPKLLQALISPEETHRLVHVLFFKHNLWISEIAKFLNLSHKEVETLVELPVKPTDPKLQRVKEPSPVKNMETPEPKQPRKSQLIQGIEHNLNLRGELGDLEKCTRVTLLLIYAAITELLPAKT